MRKRCTVSAFLPARPGARGAGVGAAEASAAVTAFLARDFRTLFALPAEAFGEGGTFSSAVIEPVEYAPRSAKMQRGPFVRLACCRDNYIFGIGRHSIISTRSPGKTVKCGWLRKSFAHSSCDSASTIVHAPISFLMSEIPFWSTRLVLPKGEP